MTELKTILIEGTIIFIVFLIIIIMSALILTQMDERIKTECEKVDNQGIVHFWDVDVDCVKLNTPPFISTQPEITFFGKKYD